MYMVWIQRARGVRINKPSSVSVVYLPISTMKMPIQNEANTFYRSCASAASPTSLIMYITHNTNPMNGAYKYTRRAKKLYWTKPVLPYMYLCTNCCFGLIYLIVWMNLSMYTYLLMNLPLSPPLTPGNLCTPHSGTLFTNIIQSKIFFAPKSNMAIGLALHKIVDMTLPHQFYILEVYFGLFLDNQENMFCYNRQMNF